MLKVGDKVKIIPEPPKDRSEGPSWIDIMTEYCGKEATITIVCQRWYGLDLNIEGLYWLESWLQPVEQDYETVFRRKRDDNLRSMFQ